MAQVAYLKDPAAYLDYKFDWSDWLEEGELIASYVLTLTGGGLSGVSDFDDGTSVTVWITSGTVDTEGTVACKITTDNSPPRIDERTIEIKVRQR